MKVQHILLLDDNESEHEFFDIVVKKLGLTLVSALTAHEALKALKGGNQLPDIIFLDLNMPTMDGFEFLAAIKQMDSLKNIPTIIFSTSSSDSDVQRTTELGANWFLSKPRLAELIEVLKWLNQQRDMPVAAGLFLKVLNPMRDGDTSRE